MGGFGSGRWLDHNKKTKLFVERHSAKRGICLSSLQKPQPRDGKLASYTTKHTGLSLPYRISSHRLASGLPNLIPENRLTSTPGVLLLPPCQRSL
jgi:hypothetical protein